MNRPDATVHIYSQLVRVLRFAFCHGDRPVPTKFVDALLRAYGTDWEKKKICRPGLRGQKPDCRPWLIDIDLSRKTSFWKRHIERGLAELWEAREEPSKDNLATQIFLDELTRHHTWAEVEETLMGWMK